MRQLDCGTGLGVVERRAGVVHVESMPGRWSAVGMNADNRVRMHRVPQRRALIDAWSHRAVVIARQLCSYPQLVERRSYPPDDVPRERMLWIATAGCRPRRVALLSPAPAVGNLAAYRSVDHGVVAGVEEDRHPGNAGRRARGVNRHGAQYDRCDTGESQDVAPGNRSQSAVGIAHRAMVTIEPSTRPTRRRDGAMDRGRTAR